MHQNIAGIRFSIRLMCFNRFFLSIGWFHTLFVSEERKTIVLLSGFLSFFLTRFLLIDLHYIKPTQACIRRIFSTLHLMQKGKRNLNNHFIHAVFSIKFSKWKWNLHVIEMCCCCHLFFRIFRSVSVVCSWGFNTKLSVCIYCMCT